MPEPAEKIVVFASYDTTIKANLAKTKLDAYGVPCFISDENFTGLYPFRNDIFPGARLQIFERDRDLVSEILTEEKSSPLLFRCRRCGSSNVAFEESEKGYIGRLFFSVALFLFGMDPMPRKRVYHCNNCSHEFGHLS